MERIRSAVVGAAAVRDSRRTLPCAAKPILRFELSSLILDYSDGRLGVSKWPENFGAIATAVGI